ncbi:BTAD domain-containing putative transcriptional regulator [Streptomyces sp. NPDC048277]|uniref:AfsR/SARP family transcriptional regulator n=1 Tax=Streptomyces sp. NPDC048277 TaxID=3155027 RepID=UPI0033DEE8BD
MDLGSPQQRAVLAALLLRRRRSVSVSELVDAVWGEDPPPAAVSVLRTYVSRLRKVLQPSRTTQESAQIILSTADGYLAELPAERLDLDVFEQQVSEARRLRAVGQEFAAGELLHVALGRWEGTALAGVPGPLAEAERVRLSEVRLAALENRFDLDIRLGHHHNVIPELTALVGEHPLRERLCRLLMLALYRSGRQAEALAAYRATRRDLVTELGVEPGPELQDLHDRILTADPSLKSGAPASAATEPTAQTAPVAEQRVTPAQLPPKITAFAGRIRELEELRALLPEHDGRPATVVIHAMAGMAGVGKTALAVHWAHEIAHRFPDGQLYINLRGFDPADTITAPEEAVRVFLDALGVSPQRIPSDLDAQTGLYRSLLADRRMLILLDNARDSDQVRPLLPGAAGCMAIVTSRNSLTGLVTGHGAHPLTLRPLAVTEAHGLLARRLGEARLTAEPQAIHEISARCGQLPLALAIVAARAAAHPGFPLSAIAKELSESADSLDAFTGGDLSSDLQAVFSWSHRALSTPAARLFRLLGLHHGPDISAPAAAALAGLPLRPTRRLLGELTHAHLLMEHRPGRYTLHDLLRVHAGERVLDEDSQLDRDRAVDRLLAWYLHTADATYPHLTPNRRRVPLDPVPPDCEPLQFHTYDQALKWCDGERANLVAAIHQAAATGRHAVAWRLTRTLSGFYYLRSHLHDWLDTARTGLTAARAGDDITVQAWALYNLASALTIGSHYDEAIEYYTQSMTLYQEVNDPIGGAMTLGNLGNLYLQTNQLTKAIECTRESLVVIRDTGDTWSEGISLANLGDAYQRLGRFDEALTHLQEALTVLQAIGDRWVEGVTLDVLGMVHHRLGHHDNAIETYYQAIEAHRDVGNRWGEGHTLRHLGDLHQKTDEPDAARTIWQQALTLFEELDHPDAEEMRNKLRALDERP